MVVSSFPNDKSSVKRTIKALKSVLFLNYICNTSEMASIYAQVSFLFRAILQGGILLGVGRNVGGTIHIT